MRRRPGEMFRNRYPQTPGKYLSACRPDAALKMLKQPGLSVAEIASLSGFTSVSYSIKIFKREMGKTPKEYRESVKKQR